MMRLPSPSATVSERGERGGKDLAPELTKVEFKPVVSWPASVERGEPAGEVSPKDTKKVRSIANLRSIVEQTS